MKVVIQPEWKWEKYICTIFHCNPSSRQWDTSLKNTNVNLSVVLEEKSGHPLGSMKVSTKFQGNACSSCWDISVCLTVNNNSLIYWPKSILLSIGRKQFLTKSLYTPGTGRVNNTKMRKNLLAKITLQHRQARRRKGQIPLVHLSCLSCGSSPVWSVKVH